MSSLARLGAAINRKKDLVRAFTYEPSAAKGVGLHVTVKFRARQAINSDLEEKRTTIVLARSKSNDLEDRTNARNELEELFHKILADNIQSIETEEFERDDSGEIVRPMKRKPVTVRHIKPLLPLDAEKIAEIGGLDTVFVFDTQSADPEVAKASRENIFNLINASPDFRSWVEQVATDVSLFQDKTFDDEVKNLSAGTAKA